MGTRVLSFREKKLIEKEIKDLESKGGCHPGSSCSRPVHIQLIASQEKRRRKPASHKSEAAEWLCGGLALQNGRYFKPERSVETRRLDGQAGSEGRILLCPDAQGLQKIPSFQVGKLQKGI